MFPILNYSTASAASFPRTSNYFLLSGSTLENVEIGETLMRYDLLILVPQAQEYNQDFLIEIKKRNPEVILLAYVPTISYNDGWTAPIYNSLKRGLKSSWWLKDAAGQQVSIWSNTRALNLTTDWNTYLADWTVEEIMETGYWDGIFYDEVSAEIDYIDDVDLDKDGEADKADSANAAWTDGLVQLLSRTRSRLKPDEIIIINGSSNGQLMPYINGRMFESFPTPWEDGGDWTELTGRYLELEKKVGEESIFILNSDSGNTGNAQNYRQVRYLLATTLLGGGFFGYDFGTESHGQTWYYDEYDVSLGEPVEDPRDLLDSDNTEIKQSVWERDFERGKAILNSTESQQTIRLDGEYEKIHGLQDPTTNDGSITSRLTLAAEDGMILLRPLQEIFDAAFTNGAFARIFNVFGNVKRTGFFAYTSRATGGERVIFYDLDGDEKREMIVAGDSSVEIFNDSGTRLTAFAPYTANYQNGVSVAIGDLESDGADEVITGTRTGGGPHVRIFNKDGKLINPGFFAYDPNFRGGVNVAVGDLDGDGNAEIVTGAGVGGGPHVRVFNKDGKLINPGFFAYDEEQRNGVDITATDVDEDGVSEIIGLGLDVFF